MKKLLAIFSSLTLLGIVLNSCDSRELPLDRIPVPYSFVVNQAIVDTGALVNTAENFSMTLTIDPVFTGNRAKRTFTLNVVTLNGGTGNLTIGNTPYTPNMEISQGTTAVSYVPTNAGTQSLVFEAKNEVGEVRRDTAYFNVLGYVPIPYTLTVSPNSFLANNRPGTQLDVNIKVTSSDLTGNTDYTLRWTTNGAASIYFNNTTAFVQPGTIQPSDNFLKLNIPGGHPDGNYWLAVLVTDENGDLKKDTIRYKVAANVAPTVSSGTSVYQYTGVATRIGSMCWTGGYPYSCYFPLPSSSSARTECWAAPYQIRFTINSADSDGSVAAWKVTIGGNTQTGTTVTPTFTFNVAADKVHYAKWRTDPTRSGCSAYATGLIKYSLCAGRTLDQGSCNGPTLGYTYAPGSTATIEVQDNEGRWSAPFYVVLGDDTWFNTNYPSNF